MIWPWHTRLAVSLALHVTKVYRVWRDNRESSERAKMARIIDFASGQTCFCTVYTFSIFLSLHATWIHNRQSLLWVRYILHQNDYKVRPLLPHFWIRLFDKWNRTRALAEESVLVCLVSYTITPLLREKKWTSGSHFLVNIKAIGQVISKKDFKRFPPKSDSYSFNCLMKFVN